MIIPSRRSFITGLMSALAAPAIVHAGNLMPVKQMLPCFEREYFLGVDGYWYHKLTLSAGFRRSVKFEEMASEDVADIPLGSIEWHNARRNARLENIRKGYGRLDLSLEEIGQLAAPPSGWTEVNGVGYWDSPYYDPLAPRDTSRI